MKKFLSFFSKRIASLHEAAYLLAAFTVLSQLLALVRDRLLAHHFGAGAELDVYYAAFRIPDIIFVSVASVVSVTVLIPFLVGRLEQDKEKAKRFMDGLFTAFFFFIIMASVVVFFFVPQLTKVLIPGITEPESREILITLTRIILLSPLLLGLSNFLASATQAHKRFFVYAASPALYNLGLIAGILFFYPRLGLAGLGWGVALGALLHLAVQIPAVAQLKFFPRFVQPNWKEVREVVAISLPRTLALSTTQILLLFLVALASLGAAGSIAVFNLSFNLQSVPLSIIGVSYSLAAFPALAALFAKKETDKFLAEVASAARHIIFWSVPATVLFVVLRAHIVRTLYGSGYFDWDGTRLTAACLALFALSVTGQCLFLLFTRGWYAAGKTRAPLVLNFACAGLTALLAYAFLHIFSSVPFARYFIESLFKVEDIAGTSVLMLPLAYSVGMLVNAALQWLWFERDFGTFSANVLPALFHSLAASIVMGFVAHQSLRVLDNFIKVQTGGGIFLQGLLAGIIGIIVALVLLKLMKNREIHEIWEAAHKKFWKAKPVISEPEVL